LVVATIVFAGGGITSFYQGLLHLRHPIRLEHPSWNYELLAISTACLHTWTGGWGTVTYWNAFVAINELQVPAPFSMNVSTMPRSFRSLRAGLGHISTEPDSDQVTSKLPALHFCQLALPAVQPRLGIDFDPDTAERCDELFSGKANCNSWHRDPLWTEPGWNQHSAAELKIDSFEAARSLAPVSQCMGTVP
jgi:hypothetical protein